MTQVVILPATLQGDSQVFRLFSGIAHNRDVSRTVLSSLASRPIMPTVLLVVFDNDVT